MKQSREAWCGRRGRRGCRVPLLVPAVWCKPPRTFSHRFRANVVAERGSVQDRSVLPSTVLWVAANCPHSLPVARWASPGRSGRMLASAQGRFSSQPGPPYMLCMSSCRRSLRASCWRAGLPEGRASARGEATGRSKTASRLPSCQSGEAAGGAVRKDGDSAHKEDLTALPA